jgi:hypothetical protein
MNGTIALPDAAHEIGDESSSAGGRRIAHLPPAIWEARARHKSKPKIAATKARRREGPGWPSNLAAGNSHSNKTREANKPPMKDVIAAVPPKIQVQTDALFFKIIQLVQISLNARLGKAFLAHKRAGTRH